MCLQKHKYISDNTDINISRHIMNYGKDIDFGRLSKLPQSSMKNLLYNTLESDLNYYIYGVPQHVPGVENIGILYSIAEAMQVSIEELTKKLITELKSHNDLFNILLNGTLIEFFQNVLSRNPKIQAMARVIC
jgi:hypothetical protein